MRRPRLRALHDVEEGRVESADDEQASPGSFASFHSPRVGGRVLLEQRRRWRRPGRYASPALTDEVPSCEAGRGVSGRLRRGRDGERGLRLGQYPTYALVLFRVHMDRLVGMHEAERLASHHPIDGVIGRRSFRS